MCHICDDWESNQLNSSKAFILIGNSLKLLTKNQDKKERDHLMELCDKIVDSLDKIDGAKSE